MGSGKLPVGQWLRIYYTYDGPVAIIYPPLNSTLFTISSSKGRSETCLWNLVNVFQRYLLLESIGRTWLNWMCFSLGFFDIIILLMAETYDIGNYPLLAPVANRILAFVLGMEKVAYYWRCCWRLKRQISKIAPVHACGSFSNKGYPRNEGKALRNILIYIVHPLFKRNFGCFFYPS